MYIVQGYDNNWFMLWILIVSHMKRFRLRN